MVNTMVRNHIRTADHYQPVQFGLGLSSGTTAAGSRRAAPFAGGTAP